MRKFVVGVAAAMAFAVGTAGPAYAHSCANVSRSAPRSDAAGGKGNWFYLDFGTGFWVMETPKDRSLLDRSRHCTDPLDSVQKNYWAAEPGSAFSGVITGCGERP